MQFDLIVIGSGPGGYKAAINAAYLGAKVALIERDLPGGTCLNQGCIPKKSLLHMASLIASVNEMEGRGLVGHVRGDIKAAMAHKNAVVKGIRDNFLLWLKHTGIRLFRGEARFIDRQRVHVSLTTPLADDGAATLELQAPRIIIATGSAPRELPACPTDGRVIVNSRDLLFNLDELPRSVLCVGGGAIGVEFGYLLHQFGAKVRIVEQGDRLLYQSSMPDRACGALERKLSRLGIEVCNNLNVVSTRIEKNGVEKNGVEVEFSNCERAHYDYVLVAVGRQPQTQGLGLEEIGVTVNAEGFIVTSEYLETSVAGIYAVGDVKRSPMFSPMTANTALYDGKLAATNAIRGNELHANYFKVPFVIHSALEMASVGLSEGQAEDAGFEEEVARSSLAGSGKARAYHDFEGFTEVVHDAETGQLLGGCIVGPEAGEQIHMLSAALQSKLGLWFFKDMSYSHPSWCEELETTIDSCASAFSRSDKIIFRPGILAGTE